MLWYKTLLGKRYAFEPSGASEVEFSWFEVAECGVQADVVILVEGWTEEAISTVAE